MKKKLVTLDKDAHWWAKEKLDWATQDKDGNWWIIPGSEFPETKVNKKMKVERRKQGQTSLRISINFYLMIFLVSVLGISLAINLVYYLM